MPRSRAQACILRTAEVFHRSDFSKSYRSRQQRPEVLRQRDTDLQHGGSSLPGDGICQPDLRPDTESAEGKSRMNDPLWLVEPPETLLAVPVRIRMLFSTRDERASALSGPKDEFTSNISGTKIASSAALAVGAFLTVVASAVPQTIGADEGGAESLGEPLSQ